MSYVLAIPGSDPRPGMEFSIGGAEISTLGGFDFLERRWTSQGACEPIGLRQKIRLNKTNCGTMLMKVRYIAGAHH